MKTCKECGSQNVDEALFCSLCGAALSDDVVAQKPIYCLNCGAVLSPDNDYCPECGTKNGETGKSDNGNSSGEPKKKKKGIIIAVVVVVILAAVAAAAVFLMPQLTKHKSHKTPSTTRHSLGETTDAHDAADDAPDDITREDDTTEEKTTQPETTTEEETEPEVYIPEELQQYADRLVPEDRKYVIDLGYDDWYINYRSSPEYIKEGSPDYNWAGKIVSGTEIYVEYICDGTWAVYWWEGRYVFSSIYDYNDPSMERLMRPIE